MPPIWVINLKRSVDRRASIRAELDRLGMEYELVEGVDGRELGPEELAANYSPSAAVELIRRELTLGEVGCSLSHLRLYQRQVDEGHEEVVILEDDVHIDPSFPDILKRREAFPADWELVLFHRVNNPPVSIWGSRRIDRHHRCVKFASIVDGTVGYLLRLSGARKLLEYGYPVRVPADCLTGGKFKTGVRLYGLDPPCVRHSVYGAAHSTMPEVYALRRRWPTRREVGLVRWARHRVHRSWWHLLRRIDPDSIV
jgi:glycosyl transferase family 25